MAAGVTPAQAGVEMQPVQQVVDWAKEMSIRDYLGEPMERYEEYITELQAKEGRVK